MTELNDPRNDANDSWKSLQNILNIEVPKPVEEKLKARLAWFNEDLQVHPYITGEQRYELPMRLKAFALLRGIMRPLVAAGVAMALIAALSLVLPGHSHPSWANVLKQFQHSNFVTATVYIRHQPFAEPEMVEYWCGSGNRLRILSGHLITFASNGSAKTFNLATRSPGVPDGPTKFIMNLYGYENSLIPLASYLKSLYVDLYDGKASESTYQINATPEISEDLLIYDLKHKVSGLFLRVWVLKTTMLPVRMHYWNEYGSRTDVLFSYSKEQPAGFFDPSLFSATMSKGPENTSAAQLMYLGLEDAGGIAIPAPGI
ncbi:MAG: hypothetical protein M0036_26625 [Desulfobacteraceae bacterium]|nr:hypothetical protein [Desulfobacteraceae bacterium]